MSLSRLSIVQGVAALLALTTSIVPGFALASDVVAPGQPILTGFPGFVVADEVPDGNDPLDYTFIDLDAHSLVVQALQPDAPPEGQLIEAEHVFGATAADVGLVFGLAPAIGSTRPDLVASLKDEGGGHTAGGESSRFRNGLVIAQVALSMLLLVSAGLLLQSLFRAQHFDPGFNSKQVLVASVDLFASGYDEERGRTIYRQLLERVGSMPQVTAVSSARKIPLGLTGTSSTSFTAPWVPRIALRPLPARS